MVKTDSPIIYKPLPRVASLNGLSEFHNPLTRFTEDKTDSQNIYKTPTFFAEVKTHRAFVYFLHAFRGQNGLSKLLQVFLHALHAL